MAPRIKYCCDPQVYDEYYAAQAGSGIPGFQGTRYQRGAGLGSMFTGLLKYVAPLLKKGVKALGKYALGQIADQGTKLVAQKLSKGIKRGAPKKSARGVSKRRRTTSGKIF